MSVLKKHFESIQEIQLETCINGTIYCLMSVPLMKERARSMGLREFLAERFRKSDNLQVNTQIDHIFDKMDEEDEEIWQQPHPKNRDEQQFVIDEEEEELDDDNNVDGLKRIKKADESQGKRSQEKHEKKQSQ